MSEGSGTGARYRRAAAKAAGSRGRRGSAQPGVEGWTLCGHRSSSSRACSPKSSKNTWDFKKKKKKRAAGAAGSGAEPLLLAGAAQGALLLATGGGAAGRGRATSGLQGDQGTWRPLSGTSWKGSFPVVCLGWEVSDGRSLCTTDSSLVHYCGVITTKLRRLKAANIRYLSPFLRVGSSTAQLGGSSSGFHRVAAPFEGRHFIKDFKTYF